MKILVVNFSVGGYAGDALQMITVVKGLQKMGHKVMIVTTDGDGYYYDETRSKLYSPMRKKLLEAKEKPIEIDTMSIYPIHCVSHRLAMYCPSAAKEARTIIKEYDVVYIINWYYHLGMVFSKIAIEEKIPVIVGPMASLEEKARNIKRNQKLLMDKIYTKKIIKHATGFHCVGTQERKSLIKLGIDSRKIIVINNSILLKNYKIVKETKIFQKINLNPKKSNYLITIGRIDPKKNLELMLKIFADLKKKREGMFLIIVGTGKKEYVDEIKKLTSQLRIDECVIFSGYVDEEEKLELIKNAKLFLGTSKSDIHTTTAIEAMALGIPVIISKESGFDEINEYKAGKTVENNLNSFIDAINDLLDEQTKYFEYSKNAIKLVKEQFSLENQIEKYEKMFEKAKKS